MTPLSRRLRLIVITDVGLAHPRTLIDVVSAAVAAGAPAIQLRDKTASARELFKLGCELMPLVHGAGALLFVNDRADVALALGADGVHVGPDDVPVAGVRRAAIAAKGLDYLRRFFIGTSTDDPAEARRLVSEGADYIGCGTVYATTTKTDAGTVVGLAGLQRVVRAVDVPVVGIGGVDAARSAEIASGTDAAGVAVVAAVMGAHDVAAAVRRLLEPWAVGS
ncbi:MAG: thiamine phosphate synthase [Gemmatimonadota bacterium]|nr:thiamine phosphate synthase [Gemmatimonadota bacterium]